MFIVSQVIQKDFFFLVFSVLVSITVVHRESCQKQS